MKIPHVSKKNNAISLSFIADCDKSLLNIPFFSHHHTMKYKRGKLSGSLTYRILKKSQPYLKNTIIYKTFYTKFLARKRNARKTNNDDIVLKCINYFRNDKKWHRITLRDDLKETGFDVSAFAELTTLCSAIDCLYKR